MTTNPTIELIRGHISVRNYKPDPLPAARGIDQDRQVGTPHGFDRLPVQLYGWTEHSARRVATPRRPGLRNALVAQGFEFR